MKDGVYMRDPNTGRIHWKVQFVVMCSFLQLLFFYFRYNYTMYQLGDLVFLFIVNSMFLLVLFEGVKIVFRKIKSKGDI